MSEPTPEPSAPVAPAAPEDPYAKLLVDLDKSVQAVKNAARRLKRTAEGMQAVERNVDRILASTRMLEINVSDLLHDPESLASFHEEGGQE